MYTRSVLRYLDTLGATHLGATHLRCTHLGAIHLGATHLRAIHLGYLKDWVSPSFVVFSIYSV